MKASRGLTPKDYDDIGYAHFKHFRVGHVQRVRSILEDIVTGRVLNRKNWKLRKGFQGALTHTFPQTNVFQLNSTPYDYVGRVEDINNEWLRLWNTCGVREKYQPPLRFGNIGTTKTNQSTRNAAMRALDDPSIVRVLCYLYATDFKRLHYAFPD